MTAEPDLAPLVKTVVVATTPARAFLLFTAELASWWPLATHSIAGEKATRVQLEGAVGGQIVEYDAAGSVGSWGTVSDWDPPHTVSFTWHPGTDPLQAGHVTVTFAPVADGTEVRLVHSGWDRRPDGAQVRDNYSTGWEYVLGCYRRHR